MQKIYSLIYALAFSTLVTAQTGKITGKIISAASGQGLSSATIILIEKNKIIVADQNGNFVFAKLTTGNYSVKCSSVGFAEKIIDEIVVKDGESISLTISLDEKKSKADEIVIVSKKSARVENVAALLITQKNAASVSDGISAESIRKTPDRSTSDVLKRVSGASIQDDRFAIIRGLNDRYNAAFINGAPLPSTESDRKAFAFDIFPSSILDNLIIYKTATPDMPAEFAGGAINITTKSIPAKNFTSVSFGLGYNTTITGKNRLYSENKGKKDWLGVDDGSRAIPAGIPAASVFVGLTPPEKADLAKLFGNYKWGVKEMNTAPNFNFQLSKGFNVERKGKEFFGALLSVTYNKNFTLSTGERNSYAYDLNAPVDQQVIQAGKYSDSIYNDETVIAALANFSFKINNKNTISWKNNYSINSDNKLINRVGPPDVTNDPTSVYRNFVRWFTSNKILSSQLIGEHEVGTKKTKINWLASYSKVNRETPNIAQTSYFYPDPYANANSGSLNQGVGNGTMFFTSSTEDIKSVKVDIIQPYTFMKSTQNFIKIGAGYQFRSRNFGSRLLGFSPYSGGAVSFDYSLFTLLENQAFTPDHLGVMSNGKGGYYIDDGTYANSDYSASSALTHGYVMNDQRFFKKFRLIYGARLERFNQKLTSVKNLNEPVNLNTVVTDVLPSVNFVYAVTPKMNLRLSYSKTLNRPEFRELAPFLFYEFVTQYTYEGLDTLQRATINNYDFRYEFFPGKAQLFSVSAFFKQFTNPIEIVSLPNTTSQTVYSNALSAEVYGVEAEFRTLISTLFGIKRENALLSRFTLAANAAYVKSNVKLGPIGLIEASRLVTDRALQGQSPYILNGSLGYNDEKNGFSSTLSLNRVGDRIIIAGTVNNADIYEKGRTVVDFQIAKFFLKNKLEIKVTARDLLAQNLSFYFDYDKSKNYTPQYDKFFSSSVTPKTFSFSATYKF